MNRKSGYVYILGNKSNSVLYVGVTSDLKKRSYKHKGCLIDGFSKKYHMSRLLYFECFDSITDAITREKQIKAGPRKNKINLIETMNPRFRDLSYSL